MGPICKQSGINSYVKNSSQRLSKLNSEIRPESAALFGRDAGRRAIRCLVIKCPGEFLRPRLFGGNQHPYYLKQKLRNQAIYANAERFRCAGLY